MSSNPPSVEFNTNRNRLIKDKVAKYSITAGGTLVLVALLLIFFYLLYVVQPIFASSHVEVRNQFALPETQEYVAAGMEEQGEIAYLFTPTGELSYYTIKGEKFGTKLTSFNVEFDAPVTSFARTAPHQAMYAYGLENGAIKVVNPKFEVGFANNGRTIKPSIAYPLGESEVMIDDEGASIRRFAFSYIADDNQLGVLALTGDQRLLFSMLAAEENMFSGEMEWSSETAEIPVEGKVDELLISPDFSRAFVRVANKIYIYNTRDIEDITRIQVLAANQENANLVKMQLLSGANSLMLVNDNGEISQWFEINGDSGRKFAKIRAFASGDKEISGLYSEFYRRTFFSTNNQGDLALYYTTSENKLWSGKVADAAIDFFAVSPRSNAALMLAGNQLIVVDIENEHPEVSWSALWQEVWYEGYPEPAYIWQSTSASDDFEAKLSLVPISFGTIKAAMYAMLFAVPIALSAAIYTAYFMSPEQRRIVKPTVEIMEALPTVILGFLAGLWLAPLIESHLPAIMLILVLTPLAIILTAFFWQNLPESIRHKVPDGSHSILLIPVVLLAGYISFALSPAVELWVFDGDVRRYITNELGIDFDQRNSLVVGIAMGFAVIPTIFSIAEDAVFSVPKHLSNGSLALGATQWQTLVRVVLLTASPGIFSAVMMGLGRAVGETMIVLMATGNTPIMDWSIFQGMRTLAANIAVEMPESEVGSTHYRILFLAAFVLFIFTFIFNTIAEFVRQRLREKYSSL
ncbi:ABC transporter permease subunit [Pseudoalteromonas spongiae]|uniref:ABC transporter permease subunit n=1 Tax=Pseudoalteromonas spongiae TaxID=298657 RepID=UPI000C2D20FF|nr:ABC transporter permease subunit [Pseudoalteromonas spongiae]